MSNDIDQIMSLLEPVGSWSSDEPERDEPEKDSYGYTYVSESDAIEQFNDWLDDIHRPVILFGMEFPYSVVAQEVDPIAYDHEFSAWLDDSELTIRP